MQSWARSCGRRSGLSFQSTGDLADHLVTDTVYIGDLNVLARNEATVGMGAVAFVHLKPPWTRKVDFFFDNTPGVLIPRAKLIPGPALISDAQRRDNSQSCNAQQ